MIGRKGYEAYADRTGGKTFDGRPMPTWDELPARIQDAWNAAGQAIAREVYDAVRAAEPCPETEPSPEVGS